MNDFNIRKHGGRQDRRFGGCLSVKSILIGIVLIIALGLLVMSLWNAVLPELINVKHISFWQALGLLVLSRILFGGLGWRAGMLGRGRDRRRMHERWMHMTPEQREQFKQHFREGGWHHERHEHHCGTHRESGYGRHCAGDDKATGQRESDKEKPAVPPLSQEAHVKKSAETE